MLASLLVISAVFDPTSLWRTVMFPSLLVILARLVWILAVLVAMLFWRAPMAAPWLTRVAVLFAALVRTSVSRFEIIAMLLAISFVFVEMAPVFVEIASVLAAISATLVFKLRRRVLASIPFSIDRSLVTVLGTHVPNIGLKYSSCSKNSSG